MNRIPDTTQRVFIAGHRGMVGSAIGRALVSQAPHVQIITAERSELDLLDKEAVIDFLAEKNVDSIYLAAAKVGGIGANSKFPAEFIYENLQIQSNMIDAAYRCGVDKLLFLGSSCIYPKYSAQPIKEDSLLTGHLEPTNEAYAIAKIAGIKMCESYNIQYGTDYRSVMPTNLYGPNDNFHPDNSHVIPALIRRFDEAVKTGASVVTIWGTGTPRREFLHVQDMAEACIYIMGQSKEIYHSLTQPRLSHINVGTGVDCTIRELAEVIARVVGFNGDIEFDVRMPDGTPRKLLDVSRLKALGWSARIQLERGLLDTYNWYKESLPINVRR